ncbi:MAG: terminase TerL endonuclease subunit [Sphaerochaeta sp.]|nr:terminase TerL endonuclease subunit [Sphaerochaeta sp.]
MTGKVLSADLRRKMEARQRELFQEYVDSVISGSRIVGLAEMQKIERHMADLDRAAHGWDWVFSWKAAHKVLCWMQANLRFPSGSVAGTALKLQPWQVFDIATLFGWVSAKNTRIRRFTTAYWQVARKNGKSTTGGGVADYLAFGDDYPGARVYIAASSLEQVQESFSAAANMLKMGFFESKVVVSDTKNNKQIDMNGAFVRGISANPKDGKLPHGLLLDEYHEHPDKALYNSIDSGRVADPTALMLIITTAGVEIGGVCHQEYEKCKQILRGIEQSDRYWISIYEPDEGDKDDDPVTWEKANPNYGIPGAVDPDTLKDRYDKCKLSEADLIDFRIKNLNRWVMGSTRWANMEAWIDRCCTSFDLDSLQGRVAFGGLDLSSTSDFTSFVLTFPPIEPGEQWKQVYRAFIPEARITVLTRQTRQPLREWIKQGYIIPTPGQVVDYTKVGEYIHNQMTLYDIPEMACDSWKIDLMEARLGEWFSDLASKYSQGIKNFSLPTDMFQEAYLTGSITGGGDPVMAWMMDSAEAFVDTNGNVKLKKPNHLRSRKRIDHVIAGIMSYDLAKRQWGEVVDTVENSLLFF